MANQVDTGLYIAFSLDGIKALLDVQESGAAAGNGEAKVWVMSDSGPQAVAIKTGVSNGRQTEVLGGELKAGMAVITDYQEAKK